MLSLTPSIHLAPSKVKSWLVQWGDKTWVLFAQLVENAATKCTNKVNTEAISFSETVSARECVFEQCRVVQRNSTSHDCLNSSSHTRHITKKRVESSYILFIARRTLLAMPAFHLFSAKTSPPKISHVFTKLICHAMLSPGFPLEFTGNFCEEICFFRNAFIIV